MTIASTWTIRLLRIVLASLVAMTTFAAAVSLLLILVLWPLVESIAAGAVSTTAHGAGLLASIGSWPSRILLCAFLLERLGIAVIVFGSLFRMLGDAARSVVFSVRNVFRLRLIAAVYAVSVISRFTFPFLVPPALRHWLYSIQWSFNIGDLVLMLIALVLAEVFHEGLRLREEAALTV